ncbi:MAG TPA: tetratricopeptide repeat protein, partial [Bacteroidales bacterium]|nr:tetratricopeptide repeat protein [Bacteroidales bacterium]
MRKISFLIAALLLSIGSISVKAQDEQGGNDPKYGSNPDRCKMNLSLYVEFYRQKNYADAYPSWSIVFNECPKSSKNLYIHGPKIIWEKINSAKDPATKAKYADTLMLMYDRRIENFGEEGKVLGYKGIDFYKLYPSKKKEALDILGQSIEKDGKNSDPAAITILMEIAVNLYKEQKLPADQVLEYYNKCSEALTSQLEVKPDAENIKKAQDNIDLALVNSGVASCDKIVPIFAAKYEANKENIDMLKVILKLLARQECTDSKVYAQASEQLNKLQPSAFSAYSLAQLFVKKGEYSKAVEYYQQAIKLDSLNDKKAQYYYEMAIITGTKLGQPSAARNYAYKAAELRKGWGKPYILVGQLYAQNAKDCGDDAYYQSLVYIAAVDKFIQARSMDA